MITLDISVLATVTMTPKSARNSTANGSFFGHGVGRPTCRRVYTALNRPHSFMNNWNLENTSGEQIANRLDVGVVL